MWCSAVCSLFHLSPLCVHLHSSCDCSKPSDVSRVSVKAGNLHTGSLPDNHFHLAVGWYPLLCMYVHSHMHCRCKCKYRISDVNVLMNRYLQEAGEIAFKFIFSTKSFFFFFIIYSCKHTLRHNSLLLFLECMNQKPSHPCSCPLGGSGAGLGTCANKRDVTGNKKKKKDRQSGKKKLLIDWRGDTVKMMETQGSRGS